MGPRLKITVVEVLILIVGLAGVELISGHSLNPQRIDALSVG